jgi:hypothetical protein
LKKLESDGLICARCTRTTTSPGAGGGGRGSSSTSKQPLQLSSKQPTFAVTCTARMRSTAARVENTRCIARPAILGSMLGA